MSRPPVVLLHGFASSFEHNWREPGWFDLLTEAGRDVLDIDLPGHGRGPHATDPAAYVDGPADGLVAALPAAGLVTLRGTDHFATTSDYRCMDAVLGFLDA